MSAEIRDHLDPSERTDYLAAQHLERYRFAALRLAPGVRVLDVACGAGYGSRMLREGGVRVVGADNNETTLRSLGAGGEPGSFLRADALQLPFRDGAFDAVVSFETIEHVVDGRAFLREMRRVLRGGGTLLCSTPNVRYTSHPAYHLKEYEPEEFFGLFREELAEVECFGQYFGRRDRLRDLGVRSGYRLARLARLGAVRRWMRGLVPGPARLSASSAFPAAAPARGPGRSAGAPSPSPAPSPYAVQELGPRPLLRIMVAVGRKPG